MSENDRYILIVEDNPQDEEIAVRALTKRNVANRIVVARDGEEAVEFLFGGGKSDRAPAAVLPQVVLLDLKLPKVDGMEILRLIRTTGRTKRMPVVVVTSSDEDRDIAESYELGVNSYVRKPVNFDAFSEAVAQIGLYWYVLNTPPKTA
jgi:two-component system response regulator